uniref:Venom protein n=1 Tax=Hadrurus spadix TaxID=141984 RepID=A0A1W7R989_9SCOR
MFIRGTFVVCALLAIADAYTYIIPQKPGAVKCTDSFGNEHQPGETWYNDEKCERLICTGVARSLSIDGAGCGAISVPGCKLERGEGSYPKCCPSC